MKKGNLLVFPTRKQLLYIKELIDDSDIYVVTRDKEWAQKKGFIVIENDMDSIIEGNVDVLCCHEEGLYWLNIYGKKNWNYHFSDDVFRILVKDKFKDFLNDADVRNAKYWNSKESIKHFPIVIKPIIGFGSIAVKKIDNREQLNEMETDEFSANIKLIDPYKNIYFSEIVNRMIYEEYIEGDFYRTPLVMEDGKVKLIYPIKGNHTTHKDNSDFHWTEFEFKEVNRIVVDQMISMLELLGRRLQCYTGVYVAEFLVNNKNEVFLIEFSPRQTSSRISKIIYYSSGIDIEKIAVDLFMGKKLEVYTNRTLYDVKMQIIRGEYLNEKDYTVLEAIEDKSVYGDKTITVYSRKTEI